MAFVPVLMLQIAVNLLQGQIALLQLLIDIKIQ